MKIVSSLVSLFCLLYPTISQASSIQGCQGLDVNNRVALCKKFECPVGYHVCNNYDIDILKTIDTNLIQGTYSTNIGYTDDAQNDYTCNLCSNDETQYRYIDGNSYNDFIKYSSKRKMITLYNPNKEIQSSTTMCNINNQWIPEGTGSFINQCLFCSCQYNSNIQTQTKCMNICHNTKTTYQEYRQFLTTQSIMETYTKEKYDCLGRSVQNNRMLECNNRNPEILSGSACCRNQNCKSPYCSSCIYNEHLQNNELCLMCGKTEQGEQTYLLKLNNNPRCMREKQIQNVCNNYYVLDYTFQNSHCLECIHGVINPYTVSNTSNIHGSCECKDGYFGEKCEYSYNSMFCNDNGNYDLERKVCICNQQYNGNDCSIYTEASRQCMNGVYDKERLKCICKYGWTGLLCDQKIVCVRGYIDNEHCICEPNFSGVDCSKFRRSAVSITPTPKPVLYNDFECVYGIYNFDTKECRCLKDYKGVHCDVKKCKYGSYNLESQSCICNDGYTGEECEKSCLEDCNYNGNNCNLESKCVCENGWMGEKCETIQIKSFDTQNSFRIDGLMLDMKIQNVILGSETSNITQTIQPLQFNIKPCFEISCVPFEIKFDTLSIFQEITNDGRFLSMIDFLPRQLQQSNENKEYTLITLNEYIDIDKEYFLITPNGNINQSYPVYSNTLFLDNQYTDFEFSIYSKNDDVYMDETNSKTKNDVIQSIATKLDIPMSNADTNSDTSSSQQQTNSNTQSVKGTFWDNLWGGIKEVFSINFVQYFGGFIAVLLVGTFIRKCVLYVRTKRRNGFHFSDLLKSSTKWRERHRTTDVELAVVAQNTYIQKENSNESITALPKDVYTSKRQSIVVTENKTNELLQQQIEILEKQKHQETQKQEDMLSYYKNPMTTSKPKLQETLRRNSHTKIYSAPKRNSIRLGILNGDERKTPTSSITTNTNPLNDETTNSIISYGNRSGGSESIYGSNEEIV